MSSTTPALGNPTVYQAVKTLLNQSGAEYRLIEHGPTRTSEESALARGEELSVGAKALLLKVDNDYGLFVVPADKKLDSLAIRKHMNAKGSRFASVEELFERTGLVPGCVPPFGEPVLPFPIYADSEVGQSHKRVAFNAGMLTVSIVMPTDEWERIARPERFAFAKAA